MLLVDITRASGGSGIMLREAAQTLLRASSDESPLAAALLLEHAARMFMEAGPTPLYRKHAFHLVMAGHLYHKCGQRHHAVRAY